MKRLVITGGPGGGKTASLEMARRILCDHVGFAPESASIVFGGGFPREQREPAERAAQRAIFHVQRELESLFDDRADLRPGGVRPGDRGLRGVLARRRVGILRCAGHDARGELGRYAAVIHLRPPTAGDGYERKGLRIETAAEAARIDARIERCWRGHPRRFFVDHTHDFVAKIRRVIGLIEGELLCAHPRRAA